MSIEKDLDRVADATEIIAKSLEGLLDLALKGEASSEKPERSTRRGRPTTTTNATTTEEKPSTEADVREAAGKLVNGFPKDKKGFLKAQAIVKDFGVGKIGELQPMQYKGVIEAFIEAHKELKKEEL